MLETLPLPVITVTHDGTFVVVHAHVPPPLFWAEIPVVNVPPETLIVADSGDKVNTHEGGGGVTGVGAVPSQGFITIPAFVSSIDVPVTATSYRMHFVQEAR